MGISVIWAEHNAVDEEMLGVLHEASTVDGTEILLHDVAELHDLVSFKSFKAHNSQHSCNETIRLSTSQIVGRH